MMTAFYFEQNYHGSSFFYGDSYFGKYNEFLLFEKKV